MTAGILGDLDLGDEGMHEIEEHQQFNESMLLTYFDRETDSGSLLRIGNRPNEGYAEVTFCVFPPSGGALFQFARADIADNDRFDAGGMRFTVPNPGEVFELAYAGTAVFFEDPRALADPSSAFKQAPRREVELAVTGRAMSALYGARSGTSVGGHYEQHMDWTGTLTVDGAPTPVRGRGNRDHSWGPRNWHATFSDRTLWCTFDDDLGIAVSLTWESPGAETEVMGTIFRKGVGRPVVTGTIESTFEGNGLYHTGFSCELVDDQGESLAFTGRVSRFIPFRHRREGHITHIGQAVTEFVCGDRVGYGLSEYMDLVQ